MPQLSPCRRNSQPSASVSQTWARVIGIMLLSFGKAVASAQRSGRRVVVLDVGSNDGQWSKELENDDTEPSMPCRRRGRTSLSRCTYEPNPKLAQRLTDLTANQLPNAVPPVAAWKVVPCSRFT